MVVDVIILLQLEIILLELLFVGNQALVLMVTMVVVILLLF